MKRNLILAALALAVFFVCFFLFWTIGQSLIASAPPGLAKLKGEVTDMAVAASLAMTMIVLMTVIRALRGKR